MRASPFVLGAALFSALAGAANTPPYSAQQATQGAATYKAQCALCHGSTLDNGGAPHLKGANFLKKWGKNSLDDFHYVMSTTMPQTNPGGLKPAEYLNLVTYVLQQNGFKVGKTALTAADLKKYTLTK